jgi:hypothetical protein
LFSRRGLAASAAFAALACTAKSTPPDSSLSAVWRDYRALPAHRALAIAGDPRREQWVAGSSGGHATRDAAEQSALSECRSRRIRQRMQAMCQLYAVGDEIVWPDR